MLDSNSPITESINIIISAPTQSTIPKEPIIEDLDIVTTANQAEEKKIIPDKNHSPTKNIKKEIAIIIKENHRLQNDLRQKNDTIASLIEQNFNELKTLKEKYDNMMNTISISHENSINTINRKYNTFRKSLNTRMRESIGTHCKISNERISILSNHNQELTTKIIELQKDVERKENKIKLIENEFIDIDKKYQHTEIKNKELDNITTILKSQLSNTTMSLENYKNRLEQQEIVTSENMRNYQANFIKEKESLTNEYIVANKELVDKYENQIILLKNEINSITMDKDQRINGLMNHLKSIIDNQYVAFGELEKFKSLNEKFKNDNSDKKINDMIIKYKKEIESITDTHSREKEILNESHKETITKLQESIIKFQESNELLQHRLNQSIEALSLSKTTITNLKDTKQDLEKVIHFKESEDKSLVEKNKELINENINLKEKLTRSLELANELSNKEKIYESQIKILQSKYNQLLLLTKKNMNNSK